MDTGGRDGGVDPPEGLGSGALTERRCRYALYCLALRGRRMRLPDVAEAVTEWEHGRPGGEIPRTRLHVYASLYHDHVPRLEEAGLVAYSQPEDALELTVGPEELSELRELAREELGGVD